MKMNGLMSQNIPKIKQAYKHIKLPKLSPVPTMITDDEKQYLYWLGRDVVSGVGAVVEIGTWFGCSAGYLGAGLRDGSKSVPFYCFDRFELQGIEKRKAREQGFDHIEELEVEADIMPITAEHLESIYSIQLYKTYIDKNSWTGGKIELLHLDAPKRESDIIHVLKTFAPFLIPEKSIIVLQDFGMPRAYSLPLIFGELREYFELVDIPSENSTMAVFVYKHQMPNLILSDPENFSFKKNTRDCIEGWNKMATYYTNPSQKAFFNFGLALYFFRKGEKELAVKIAKENAPYLSVEKAELLDKRLCTRIWKLAFK